MQGIMRSELGVLRREGLLDASTYGELRALYPSGRWDFSSLSRWFLIFGAIAFISGVAILGATIFEPTLPKLAMLLGVLIVGCFYTGWVLRTRSMTWTKRSLELVGGIAVIGLSFTLGIIFSSGSGNWPALLLIDMLILLPLAYLLRNVLLVILNLIVFFAWFGGVTGYISGWGAYFFGMNYPMRFLIAGISMASFGLVHRGAEQQRLRAYDGFFKVWLSGGIFFSEMSLWLMSLFGNYGSIFNSHLESAGELFLFNAMWAGANVGLLQLGSQYQLRMLRGYAMTFLLIQAYTIYFWHIAEHLGPVFAAFLAGAVTLGLVVHFESKRRGQGSPELS
jgi:hypothetical protein